LAQTNVKISRIGDYIKKAVRGSSEAFKKLRRTETASVWS
jgi:hypothetical protein